MALLSCFIIIHANHACITHHISLPGNGEWRAQSPVFTRFCAKRRGEAFYFLLHALVAVKLFITCITSSSRESIS